MADTNVQPIQDLKVNLQPVPNKHAEAVLLGLAKQSKLLPVDNIQDPMPLSSPGFEPLLSPDLAKDLEAYLEAMAILQEMRQKLKAMAANLKHMKNVMYGVVEIMNMFQNVEGGQIRALSAVDNIDSDLRDALTGAQGAVNSITGGSSKDPSMAAKKLIAFVDEMQRFIDAHGGAKGVIGGGALQNLQDAINTIKGVFSWNTSTGKTVSDWGDPGDMAQRLIALTNEAKAGTFTPALKNLQFGFQQFNQTVSALSTTTSTNLQFVSEMFKQFLGIDESAMQSYQKGNLQMVQNQRTN